MATKSSKKTPATTAPDVPQAPAPKYVSDEELEAIKNTLRFLQLKVCSTHPYFAVYIYQALTYIIEPSIKTFGVDAKLRFFYNPGMFDECTTEELAGAFIHELHHVIKDDCKRMTKENGYEHHHLVNVAQDLVINQHIRGEDNKKVQLPKFALFPENVVDKGLPPNQTAEWYYKELEKRIKKQKKKNGDKEGEGEGDKEKGTAPSGGSCGSISGGGDPKKWEEDSPERPLPEGVSDIQKEYYKKATAQAIKVRNGQMPGDVAGDLLRWADEILNPKIDWKKELRSTIMNDISRVRAGLSDYTYRRISRRQHEANKRRIIAPGFQTFDPTVAVIMDTSGSMDETQINQAIAETLSVMRNTQARVVFISCDAAVFSIGTVNNKKELSNKVGGGGGTDMRVAYKAIEDSKWKPQLIICLTDGYTPWPDSPIKGTKNIICITLPKNDKGYGDAPKWAKVIHAAAD